LGCPQVDGATSSAITAGDFDGDKKVDLAVECFASGTSFLNVFTGKGDGSFGLFGIASNDDVLYLTTADINGDGIFEYLYVGDSGIVFGDLAGFNGSIPGNLIVGAQRVATGDFNGDGKLDLLEATEDPTSGNIPLIGDGHGNFHPFSAASVAKSVTVADFNGDGLSDYALSESPFVSSQPILQVELSNGDGSFRPGATIGCCGQASNAADFNGDGIPDLVSLGVSGFPGTDVYLGQVDGALISSGTPLPYDPSSLTVVGDFDNNGSPDLAVLDPTTGLLSILFNTRSFQLTSTLLSQAASGVAVGQPFTLQAAVSSKQGVPTGTVTFKQAGVPQTTATLTSGQTQATLNAPSTAGQYGFTALYTGDGTFGGSLSQRLLVTVSAASTTTTLTSSGSPSKLGQPVTFTATIHPQYSGQPTGTVEFYADGNPIGSASVSGGQAALSTSSLTMGAHTIQADYSGDSSFTTSLGSTKQKVGDAASSIQLTSSLNPAGYGQAVMLTATVTDSAGSTPAGVVVFSERGDYYGTVTLSGGVAQIALPTTLAAGKHTITAQYSGDSSDGPAKASLTQVITGASSTTTIATDTEPSTYGQTVTFTAVVSSTVGTPDGTVTFKNGSATLGTVALSGGQATYAISTLNGGTHTIKALYNGSSGYGPSSASVFQIVEPAATTTTLTSSLNPAPFGQTVTFTAVVTSAASATFSGTVTIKDGKKVLGSASLVNGQMQISASLLAEGGHTLTATYAGSANFSGSSGTLSQTIQ
jgi:hypothetical protein